MTNLSVIRGLGAKSSSKRAEPLSVAKLRTILEDEGMRRRQPKESFQAFEERLHRQLQEVEREVLAEVPGRQASASIKRGLCSPPPSKPRSPS
jgi:hypothetical protein